MNNDCDWLICPEKKKEGHQSGRAKARKVSKIVYYYAFDVILDRLALIDNPWVSENEHKNLPEPRSYYLNLLIQMRKRRV